MTIACWWRGKTVQDRCMAVLPWEVKDAYAMSVLSANGNMTAGDDHIMLDFERILTLGAERIIAEAREKLRGLPFKGAGCTGRWSPPGRGVYILRPVRPGLHGRGADLDWKACEGGRCISRASARPAVL